MDDEKVKDLAELVARRVVDSLREELGEVGNKVNRHDQTLYNGNGLVKRVDAIEKDRKFRYLECESKFNLIRSTAETAASKPREEVKKWRWMFAGAAIAIPSVFGLIQMIKMIAGKG